MMGQLCFLCKTDGFLFIRDKCVEISWATQLFRMIYLVAEENASAMEIGVVHPGLGHEAGDFPIRCLDGERLQQKLVDVAVFDDDGSRSAEVLGHLEVHFELKVHGDQHVAGGNPVLDRHFGAHRCLPGL